MLAPSERWDPIQERRRLPSPWRGAGRNFFLFLLTVGSVWAVEGLNDRRQAATDGWLLVGGVMSILLAHEMGHYLACRYYRVDASLPYFLPSLWIPLGLTTWVPLSFVGTFGAVIRIREPFPNRRVLFDIGIAGPLAGFVVCLPVLILGLWEAQVVPIAGAGDGISLGQPLLFRWATWAMLGSTPDGHTLVIGPLGTSAWFGLLVTALNLVPVGQLDGGHVSYAILRRRSLLVSRAAVVVALFLLYLRPTWILWAVLLFLLGRRCHPPTLDDRVPLGNTRVAVGVLGAIVFALCFTPNPFLISWGQFLQSIGEVLHWLLTSP